MHWDLLDTARRKILPSLTFLKEWKCYLAGETALALHLGHRRSVDFDFYTPEPFNEMRLEQEVVSHLSGFKVTQRGPGTLTGQSQGIDFSFFHYPYPLLEPPIEDGPLRIAATADIAAMKLIAISQRGLRRDFVDMYVISQEAGLEKVFEWAGRKFTQFDRYSALKALAYFRDAENDESGRGMELSKPMAWSKIRHYFEKETRALTKKWL